VDAARQIWQNVVRTFHDVKSEERWVRLSEDGLRELNSDKSAGNHTTVQAALRRARSLRDQGERDKAEEIWKGLEALYRNDPAAEGMLREIARDRGP
jgi:hypothetical protein